MCSSLRNRWGRLCSHSVSNPREDEAVPGHRTPPRVEEVQNVGLGFPRRVSWSQIKVRSYLSTREWQDEGVAASAPQIPRSIFSAEDSEFRTPNPIRRRNSGGSSSIREAVVSPRLQQISSASNMPLRLGQGTCPGWWSQYAVPSWSSWAGRTSSSRITRLYRSPSSGLPPYHDATPGLGPQPQIQGGRVETASNSTILFVSGMGVPFVSCPCSCPRVAFVPDLCPRIVPGREEACQTRCWTSLRGFHCPFT